MNSNQIKKQMNKNHQFAFEFHVKNSMIFDIKFQITIRSNKNLNYKNLNFFIVKRIIDNCVYELKFFDAMQNIFFVFHF